MRARRIIYSLLILVLISSFLAPGLVFSKAQLPDYTIDGDVVYIDTPQAYLAASPHTSSGGWVYLNLTSKLFSGSLDIGFGYDSESTRPRSLDLWSRKEVSERIPDRFFENNTYYKYSLTAELTEPPLAYNGTVYLWTLIEVYWDEETNSTWEVVLDDWVLVDSMDFDRASLVEREIYWIVDYWKSVANNNFAVFNYGYGGMDRWYYTSFEAQAGKEYYARIWLDIIPSLDGGQSKYWVVVKPSSESIQEALANGHLYALDPWYDPGWSYRKSHTITGSTSGAQTDYQVGIKVYYGAGTDGTESVFGVTMGKVYCDSESRTDFGDIRFVATNEETLLDYWMEYKVDSDYAIFWVEVDSIPVNPATDVIYMYYGKADATTTSNGPNTFIIFEDNEAGGRYTWTPNSWCITDRVTSPTPPRLGTYSRRNYYTTGVYYARTSWATTPTLAASNRIGFWLNYHFTGSRTDTLMNFGETSVDWINLNAVPASMCDGAGAGKIRTGNFSYMDGAFTPSDYTMSIDTWYYIEMVVTSTTAVDYFIYSAAGSLLKSVTEVSMDGFSTTATKVYFYVGTVGSYQALAYFDDMRAGKYVDPEPTHGAWGSAEMSSSITHKQVVPSNSTPVYEQWFFLNTSIEVKSDTSTFLVSRIDLDPLGMNLSCSYTNSTDTFAVEHDTNNYLELDLATSKKTDENSTNVRIDYYIRIHPNVTKEGLYHVGVYSTAYSSGGNLNASDTYSSVLYIVASTSDWLDYLTYRKLHIFTGSTAGPQPDYQVGIMVYYGTGTDGVEVVNDLTYGKIYTGSKCMTNFGDIRFASISGTRELDYWIENKTDSDWALIWVKVDIPASPNNATVYIYYGGELTTTSNGTDTFPEGFDDFTGATLDPQWSLHEPYPDNANIEFDAANDRLTYSRLVHGPGDIAIATAYMDKIAVGHAIRTSCYREFIFTPDYPPGHSKDADVRFITGFFEFYYGDVSINNTVGDHTTSTLEAHNEYLRVQFMNATTSLAHIGSRTLDRWEVYDVFWHSDHVELLINGSSVNSTEGSQYIPTVDLYVVLGGETMTNDAGFINKHWDWVFVREYCYPEPGHGDWEAEEYSPYPTITSATIPDRDDNDNCYEMESYYTFVVVVNSTGGATEIDRVYILGTQVETIRFEARLTGLTGTPTWSIQTGDTVIDLDAGSSSWVEDGTEGTATFKIRFEFDFTDEADLELRAYVKDWEGRSSGPTTKQTDYFDVIGRLVISNLAVADGRINRNTATTFGGNVYYATTVAGDTPSAKFPLDAQFTAVHIHDSAHSTQGNDATIVNGAFSGISVTVPDAVQSNTYHVYLDLVADYTDADAPDADTVAVIGDEIVFKTATTLEVDAAYHDADNSELGLWYAELMYDYDDTEMEAGTVTLNTGAMTWDAGDGRWEYTIASATVQSLSRNIASVSGSVHGITALNAAVSGDSEAIVFDALMLDIWVDDTRTDVSANIEVRANITLAYDQTIIGAGDAVSLNGSAMSWDAVNLWWDLAVSQASVTEMRYQISSITDNTYGITTIGVLDFDGDNDYVVVNHDSSITFVTEDFSIESSTKPSVKDTVMMIATKGRYNVDGWRYFWHSNERVYMETSQTPAANQRSYTSILTSPNVEYRVTVARSGATYTLYIDGALDTDYYDTHIDPMTTVKDLVIGASDVFTGDYNGTISYFRLYNRSLSVLEQEAYYRGLRSTTGLVLDMKATGVNIEDMKWYDTSGEGNDGTITGATVIAGSYDDYFVLLIWDQIEIVSVAFEDSRVNIGATVEVRYVLRYDFDDVQIDDGKATISGWVWDSGNSWWDKSVSAPASPGADLYDEDDLSGVFTDDTYSLTVWEDDAGASLIGDRIEIVSVAFDDARVNIGETVEARYKLRYDYDDVEIDDGKATISGWTWDGGNSWWDKSVTAPSSVGADLYDEDDLSGVFTDDTYGITAWEDDAGTNLIGDRINFKTATLETTDDHINSDATGEWYAELLYEYDSTEVTDGTLTLNEVGASTYFGSQYRGPSVTGEFFDAPGEKFAVRFTAQEDKSVENVSLYVSRAGTDWSATIGIQGDSGGFPDGTYIGANNITIDGVTVYDSNWWTFTLASTVPLTDQTVYHIVVDVIWADSTHKLNFRGTHPRGQSGRDTWVTTHNLADPNLGYEAYSGSWALRIRTPIFVITYTDGSFIGQPYTSVELAQKVYGSSFHGQWFWTPDDKMTIDTLGIYIRKQSSPGDLNISLETESGVILRSVIIPVEDGYPLFDWEDGSIAEIELNASTLYRLRLRSPGGDAGNFWDINHPYMSYGAADLNIDDASFGYNEEGGKESRWDGGWGGSWYWDDLSFRLYLVKGSMEWDAGDGRFEYTNAPAAVVDITRNIAAISGNTYGITILNSAVTSDSETIEFDEVVFQTGTLEVLDGRIDVGATGTWYGKLMLDNNDAVITSGTITLNTGTMSYDGGDSRWEYTNVTGSVASVSRNIVSVSGITGGITKVHSTVTSDSEAIIFDRIQITALGIVDGRVSTGTIGTFNATAILEYDSHALGAGDWFSLGGYNFTWTAGESRFEHGRIESSVGLVTVNSYTSGHEATYGISVGDINGQTANEIWDEIKVYWEEVDDTRTNVDSNVEWRVKAVLAYDEHALGSSDGITTAWGAMAWDGTNTWFDLSHTESTVGAYTISFTVGSEVTYGITSIGENITETSVTFDRLVVVLSANITSPDAGEAVRLVVISWYDYDDVILPVWTFHINRNGSYFGVTPITDTHDMEVTYVYTIENVTESEYDIDVLAGNSLTIQWGNLQIDIFNTSVPDSRVTVDTTATVYWNARYGSNNSVVPSGNITVDGETYDFNATGWAESSHTNSSVGSYDYEVTAVSVEGETDFTQTTANPNLIFDRVRITDLYTIQNVVEIGTEVDIFATAELQYDLHTLGTGDTLVISGETFVWNDTQSKFVLTTSYDNGMILTLDEVITVIETTYGITSGFMDDYSLTVGWVGVTGGGEPPSAPGDPGAPVEPTPIDPSAVEVLPEEPGIEDLLPDVGPPPSEVFMFGMFFLILIMAVPPIYFWMRKEQPLQEIWGEELRAARKGFWGMVWFKRDDEDRDRPKLQRRRSIPGRLVGELRQRTIRSGEALQRTVTSGARGLERTAGIVGRPGEVVRRSVRSKEGLRRRREVLSGLGRVPKRTIQGGQGLVRKTFEGGRSTWRRVRAFGDRRD